MAVLAPFRGIFYNQEIIKDIALVVTPPYDVISKEEQEKYYQRHPFNIIRLVLGKDLAEDNSRINKYIRAANHLETWQRDGVLIRDTLTSICYYQQEFTVKRDQRKTRKGFIALIKLEDFANGVVLPHEKTMTGPKSDRLRLIESCNANLSPIFSLYSDTEKKIERIIEEKKDPTPFIDYVNDNGIRNQLWKIYNKDVIDRVSEEFKGLSLFIADGHHRYETALHYRNQLREKSRNYSGNEAYNYVMMYLSNMDDAGLVILPTHRLLYNLNDFRPSLFYEKAQKYFYIEAFGFAGSNEQEVRRKLINKLEIQGQKQHTFGLYIQGANCYNLLTLKDEGIKNSTVMENVPDVIKGLDVNILQKIILNSILGLNDQNMESQRNVDFIENSDKAIEWVKEGRYQLTFLMNPTKIKQVNEASCAQVRMPQKATFFYPKIPSGLVINSILGDIND
ncbi:MAG: DUF1015 domain-containing protein [Thermodesulfobacteriota bacterium]|nr:DUF1015 domain-containing protein [Thermodesulfobacteriota bacterium]